MDAGSGPYAQLARFYDLGHDGFDTDCDLYEQLARRSDAPVLEAGVGSGRVALALAQRRFAVTGIDTSPAMLALARAKAAAAALPLELVETDMRDPNLVGRFGLIICAIDTFLHLADTTDQVRALTAWRELLAPGGRIAIDLPGPASDWSDWEPGARPVVLDWSVEADGRRVSRYLSFRADLSLQTRQMFDVYEEIDPDGAARRHMAEYTLRFIFPAEAELLLRLAGLRLVGRYGDYGLAPFDAESQRLILVADRQPQA